LLRNARRFVALVAAVAAIAAITLCGSPVYASAATSGPGTGEVGGIGLRLVDAPISARDDPRARLYIVDHLPPGAVISRRIEVSNTTTSKASVTLYAAAATIEKGAFLGAAGHIANDVSAWTTVSPNAPDLPAGGRLTATVTITVPRDAAPGEQYGVVWAEIRAAPGAGGGVTQVSRVGIRLYLSIGPGGAPSANFAIDSVTAERTADGHPMVVATVRNTGGRALDMGGALDLAAGPGGLRAGPFLATLGITLATGDTEPVTFALDKRLPAGPWNARITLYSGLLERTAQATITFPESGTSTAVSTKPARAAWMTPAITGLAVLLLVGAVALLVKRGRRRGGPTRAPGTVRPAHNPSH
jgi:hypothetical protein